MPRTQSVTGLLPLRFGVIHYHASIVTGIYDACNLLFLLAQNIEPHFLISDAKRVLLTCQHPCLLLFELRVPMGMVLATEIDRHLLGREA